APDRRAQVEPRAVGADFHIDVAAMLGIPTLYRRRPLAGPGRARDQRPQSRGIPGPGQALVTTLAESAYCHQIVTVVQLVSFKTLFNFRCSALPRCDRGFERRGVPKRKGPRCMSVMIKEASLSEREMVAEAERALADISKVRTGIGRVIFGQESVIE